MPAFVAEFTTVAANAHGFGIWAKALFSRLGQKKPIKTAANLQPRRRVMCVTTLAYLGGMRLTDDDDFMIQDGLDIESRPVLVHIHRRLCGGDEKLNIATANVIRELHLH